MQFEELGAVTRRQRAARGATYRLPSPRLIIAAALTLCIVLAGVVVISLRNVSQGGTAGQVAPAEFGVVFVLDGARPQDVISTSAPNIRQLLRRGTSYARAWVGQMQPSLAASNATLATGRFPRMHGLLGTVWSGSGNAPTDVLSPQRVLVGSIDQALETAGVTPLAALIKDRFQGASVVSIGGAGCAAASAAGSWAADYVLCPVRFKQRWVMGAVAGHEPPSGAARGAVSPVPAVRGPGIAPTVEGWRLGAQDDWVARCALWVIANIKPRLLVVNFPEIEQVAPWVPAGQREAMIRRLVAGIDADIGRLVAEMKRRRVDRDAAYIVTSDGAVTPTYTKVKLPTVREAVLAAGGEATYLVGGSAILLGLRDRLQVDPVIQALLAEKMPQIDAIFSRDSGANGVFFRRRYLRAGLPRGFPQTADYLVSTMASNTAPDVLMLLQPHSGTSGPRIGRFSVQSVTGGAQWDSQHIPLVVAGHGVVANRRSSYPARLVDIAPTLGALLGISGISADGSALADALSNSSTDSISKQRASAQTIEQSVSVLERRLRQH